MPIKPIIPNKSKTSHTGSIYSFIWLVHRRNNPNKKTLIYIHLSHVTVLRAYTTRVAKQHSELLISTLLLLLTLPIYLGMCPSVPTHIHPYMSKLRLLFETDDETNMLCLQWVSYIPGTTAQDVPMLTRNLPLGKQEGWSYIMLIQKYNRRQGVSAPLGHLEALR